ncbi:MAG TPA: quinone-dependent dihydroorotate dehydrogenase [Crenotrichaceae bacterium]|nr:quinone-dependent dihydroorotate dehydrogenase [Crenotrichaceae bacterium]
MHINVLYPLARALLFRLPPETAHHLTLITLQQLSRLGHFNPARQTLPANPVTVMGLTFPNQIGLAAGLDKNADCIDGLSALGFGFIEIGTVTPLPQPGNPQPRLFRIPQAQALINRMGFNNKGIDNAIQQIKNSRYQGILGINIGKNRATPVESALDDYNIGLQKAYCFADYITVNISSPNTPGLRELQAGEQLNKLLSGLSQTRHELEQKHQKTVPIAIKIAPDCTLEQLNQIADLSLCHAMDAIIATNTTSSRTGVEGYPHADQQGGLSGAPLFEKSLQAVSHLKSLVNTDMVIIGCGGITTRQRANEMLSAGASLLQVFSGLIYQGPGLLTQMSL